LPPDVARNDIDVVALDQLGRLAADDLDRRAEAGEALGLTGPDERLEQEGALLRRDVDRVRVDAAAANDLERRVVVAVGIEQEAAGRAELEQIDPLAAERGDAPRERDRAPDLVRLDRLLGREAGEEVRPLLEHAVDLVPPRFAGGDAIV